MSPEISERSFEEAIECGLLQHGPDACAGDATAVRETPSPYGESAPGGVSPYGGEVSRTAFASPAQASGPYWSSPHSIASSKERSEISGLMRLHPARRSYRSPPQR